jgi:hypothetical protein
VLVRLTYVEEVVTGRLEEIGIYGAANFFMMHCETKPGAGESFGRWDKSISTIFVGGTPL